MKKITFSLPLACLLLFNGCATNNAFMDNIGKIGGTTAGAGVGAVVGKQLGGRSGLIAGALIGGTIGYLIGDEIDKRRAELAKIAKEEKIEVYSEDVTSENLAVTKEVKEDASTKKANVIGDSFTVFSNEQQFGLNSSNLNPKAEQLFNKIASQYKSSDKKILIIGHTDDSGSSSYNQKLSEERAKNVGDIFSISGVKKTNIYYLGAGENNPIANNNTIDGANKNRRVEIVELKDESDILNYASRTSNPEFFRKIEPKIIVEKIEKPKNTKVVKVINDEKPLLSTNETQPVNLQQKDELKTVNDTKDIFDFNGKKVVDNSFALKTNFGDSLQNSNFSLITKAQANNSIKVYQNCLADKPRVKADVKSLETNKVVYKTIDYKKGLNNVPFITNLENTLISINPVAVLENSSSASNFPKASFYKDYKGEKDAKPTLELSTLVNTYQGTEGLIYRVFFEEQNTQMKCMDIVFDEKNVNSSKGVLYYTKNNQILEKQFEIARIK